MWRGEGILVDVRGCLEGVCWLGSWELEGSRELNVLFSLTAKLVPDERVLMMIHGRWLWISWPIYFLTLVVI